MSSRMRGGRVFLIVATLARPELFQLGGTHFGPLLRDVIGDASGSVLLVIGKCTPRQAISAGGHSFRLALARRYRRREGGTRR